MAFEWTDDMPAMGTHPEIETHQRLAISTAATAFDAIMDQERERPAFNGGHYATPVNGTAQELVAAVEEALDLAAAQTGLDINGAQRQQMIAVAVRAADQIWRESQAAKVTMERYWPRFVLRFGIHRGPRPKVTAPFPPEPVAAQEPLEIDAERFLHGDAEDRAVVDAAAIAEAGGVPVMVTDAEHKTVVAVDRGLDQGEET